MRLERLRIEGFGHFTGFELELGPGLNLVHGENEAGKSTLLGFIRSVLFGFEGRKAAGRYQLGPGPFGGELWLSTGRGRLLVRRMGGRKAEGELVVRGSDGEAAPPSRLSEALRGVSRELYGQLFAFGLDELSSFEELAGHSSVTEALFAAGMQGARRLPEVTAELRRASEELFRPAGRRQRLNEVLARLEEVRAALFALGDLPSRYFELLAARRRLEQEAEALGTALRGARAERERLGALEKAAPALLTLERLRAELSGLPEALERFPVEGVARLEAALDGERRAALEVAQVRGELERLREDVRGLQGTLIPEDVADRLRAAREAFGGRLELLRGLEGRRAALAARRRQAEEAVTGLGLGVDPLLLLELDVSARARTELAARTAAVDLALRSARQLEHEVREAGLRAAEVRADLRRRREEHEGLCDVDPAELRRRHDALIRLPALESEARRLDERERELRRELEEVRGAEEPAPEAPVPAWWSLVALVFAAAVAVAAHVHDGPRTAAIAFGVGTALASAIAALQRRSAASHRAALTAHQARCRHRDERLARLGERLARVQEHIASLSRQRAQVSSEAGALPRERVAELLREAEQRVVVAKDLVTLAERERRLSQELEDQRVRADLASGELDAARRALASALRERALPESLDGDAARTLFDAVADAQRILRELAVHEEALAADERACASVAAALARSAREANLGEDDPEARFGAAGQLLERRVGEAQRLREAEKRIGELETQLARFESERAHHGRVAGELLRQGGASDAEEFRRRASEAAARAAISAELRTLRAAVEGAARCAVEEAAAQLEAVGGGSALGERAAQETARVEALEARQRRVEQERGELRQELSTLETDQRVAQLRDEEERLVVEAGALARRYARDRLGLALLARARRQFEREQQPRVVQRASAHFAQLTAGRYQRVFVPTGERAQLRVLDLRGEERSAEQLSRGTREQLYLAFRLAVVEDFGESRGTLPVVLDDILVNFDPRRARHAVTALAQLAQRHQVIAFTCHRWVAEWFREEGAQISELSEGSSADSNFAPPHARVGSVT